MFIMLLFSISLLSTVLSVMLSPGIESALVSTFDPHHVRFVGVSLRVLPQVTAASLPAPAFDDTLKSRYSAPATALSVFVPINVAEPICVNLSSLVVKSCQNRI